jgi:hypothetical protein
MPWQWWLRRDDVSEYSRELLCALFKTTFEQRDE